MYCRFVVRARGRSGLPTDARSCCRHCVAQRGPDEHLWRIPTPPLCSSLLKHAIRGEGREWQAQAGAPVRRQRDHRTLHRTTVCGPAYVVRYNNMDVPPHPEAQAHRITRRAARRARPRRRLDFGKVQKCRCSGCMREALRIPSVMLIRPETTASTSRRCIGRAGAQGFPQRGIVRARARKGYGLGGGEAAHHSEGRPTLCVLPRSAQTSSARWAVWPAGPLCVLPYVLLLTRLLIL